LRDGVAGTMQSQLDEIARGLVTAFAETARQCPCRRLFHLVRPHLPCPPGTLVDGLAGTISINAAMDPGVGGNAALAARRRCHRRGLCRHTTGGASYSTC